VGANLLRHGAEEFQAPVDFVLENFLTTGLF
jgi:hypothetical protein